MADDHFTLHCLRARRQGKQAEQKSYYNTSKWFHFERDKILEAELLPNNILVVSSNGLITLIDLNEFTDHLVAYRV